MNALKHYLLILLISLPMAYIRADFFEIKDITYHSKIPQNGIGVWQIVKKDKAKKDNNLEGINIYKPEFVPCIEVKITTEKSVSPDQLILKTYFYDEQGKNLADASPSGYGKASDMYEQKLGAILRIYKNRKTYNSRSLWRKYESIFEGKKTHKLFFALPKSIQKTNLELNGITTLVVVGDKDEVDAKTYPHSAKAPDLYDFLEKKIYLNSKRSALARTAATDSLYKHIVKTNNPLHPQITLFLRLPDGVSDITEVKGLLAVCIIADLVKDLEYKLRGIQSMDGPTLSITNLALKNLALKKQFAVLVWAPRKIWDSRKNYDEYSKDQYQKLDKSFESVANAWARGVDFFHRKYGTPNRDIIIAGSSKGAQWAHRMALQKPEYFRAVIMHIPSSFDRPIPEASKILWCLTTGELESGYERSLRFFADCKKLNYPIVYKAIPGLGHSRHEIQRQMHTSFFEFVTDYQGTKEDYEKILAERMEKIDENEYHPWPEPFRNAPFIGDAVNQELATPSEVDMVPEGFRVYLPTEKIAQIWNQDPNS